MGNQCSIFLLLSQMKRINLFSPYPWVSNPSLSNLLFQPSFSPFFYSSILLHPSLYPFTHPSSSIHPYLTSHFTIFLSMFLLLHPYLTSHFNHSSLRSSTNSSSFIHPSLTSHFNHPHLHPPTHPSVSSILI